MGLIVKMVAKKEHRSLDCGARKFPLRMLMPSIPAAPHMLSGRWLTRFLPVALFLLIAAASRKESAAQTVQVDVTPSHVVNKFSPLYALGTTVDRVPSNATDMFFRPDQVKQVLSAGWGSVSYRQNTELFVQAWHWNPKGKWSDPSGKGYFTGDATPTSEVIRHSYGYSLQHRGFTRNGGTEFDGFSRLDDGDLNTYWKSNPYLTGDSPAKRILFIRNGWSSTWARSRA